MADKAEIFGKRLKVLRNNTGKSQEDVAAAIGISRARYSHYENNHVEPDIDLIRKLADYHNVDTDFLLGRTDMPHFLDVEESEEQRRAAIMKKIATEFPDIDLMFNDIKSWTAEEFEELYDYIKFKESQKKKGE